MIQKRDIENREDIDRLMVAFYERAMSDDVIGHVFTQVAGMDLAAHLPVIGDFWEAVLFGSKSYAGRGRNPLEIHARLDRKSTLSGVHFDRWLKIFDETTDSMFAGERAEFAKLRATAIANRMRNYVRGVSALADP
ncbi:MAG TPA: group III truncated hemoglobin [Pyrinomonadaceae bacterium]|nr:group III truncated hemoglobin [Pyrinomonadaceae bacterium]HNU07913.1 group III truncated hemoglobin [Pyrinomonadaceae bacterium]